MPVIESRTSQIGSYFLQVKHTLADRETLQRSHGISAGETLRDLRDLRDTPSDGSHTGAAQIHGHLPWRNIKGETYLDDTG